MKTKREKMTEQEARSFDRYSVGNAVQAMQALKNAGACVNGCQPYEDIYTFKRWLAQGYVVQKGQHGARLSIIIDNEREDEEGKIKHISRPWATTVFCRCQVDKKNGASAANTSAA